MGSMANPLKADTKADTLLELENRLAVRKYGSDTLRLRLDYNEQAQVLEQYLSHVYDPTAKKQPVRLWPHFLPTQASGRWSTTRPPLPNFPEDIRDVIIPDPYRPWIVFDFDAIEAKEVAAYSHDLDDLSAFDNGYDIHTMTACKMTGMPFPPNLVDPHQSPECAEWREKLGWKGKDDKRRILAKVRYCLLYGKDWTAVKGSKYEKDMVKMGFRREEMWNAAKMFLKAKPNLVSTKRKYWNQCARAKEARTFFGRRRRLFGDWWSMAKEGWNHMIQGAVSEMLNYALIEITDLCPDYTLVYPSHDAGKISVPISHLTGDQREATIAYFKKAVEKQYVIDGETITTTATWAIWWPDGTKEAI